MLWRSKSRKSGTDNQTDNRITLENQQEMESVQQQETIIETKPPEEKTAEEKPMSREELLKQSEEARKLYENIINLRKSVKSLRIEDDEAETAMKADVRTEDSQEVLAAKKAIMERARADEEKEKNVRMKYEEESFRFSRKNLRLKRLRKRLL